MKFIIVLLSIADLTLGQWPQGPAPACVGAQCVKEVSNG